jgi:hypothetical protein
MDFYVGLHHPSVTRHFARCMVSVNVLRPRKADLVIQDWLLDSGAFTELATHGRYRDRVEEYAARIQRWKHCGRLQAAVSQDYMCEAFILAKTGLTVADHQRLTIERYDALRGLVADVHILPVLQGYQPAEYVAHVRQYGDRLTPGMWVGVGSVCKRNANSAAIERVLYAIKAERPDLKLHGFGIKTMALESDAVVSYLHSADSMAWSFAARREGRNGNDYREAQAFVERIARTMGSRRRPAVQLGLW